MVWHNLRMYIHESHSNRCSMVYLWVYAVLWVWFLVTHMTFKYSNFRALKSVTPKSSGGLRPLDPPAGALPLHPARGPKAGPWAPGPHPKSARAYALAMCAPRTCLPPPKKKNRLALTRSLCALCAHVCPKKNRTPAIQKNRLALRARYVRYAHMFAPP